MNLADNCLSFFWTEGRVCIRAQLFCPSHFVNLMCLRTLSGGEGLKLSLITTTLDTVPVCLQYKQGG